MGKFYFFILMLALPLLTIAQNNDAVCSYSNTKQISSKINYPGDSNIDVTYYKLELNVDYDNHLLTGITTIQAKSKLDALQNIFLDLESNMIVENVKIGNTVLPFTHDNNVIDITLDKAYQEDELITLQVYYEGNPQSSGFGSFVWDEHNGEPLVWSLSEPYGSPAWWPCKDTPADKADSSDVWITADEFFTSVSNGTLEEVTNNGDGTKTYKWENRYPIAQYLISIAMTNYEEYDQYFNYSPAGSMLVAHYIYPEKMATVKPVISETVDMLEVFSDLFGLYPFINEKYGHAQCGFSGGMEHQSITSIGGNIRTSLVSHELAHQWFGDKITCKDWQNIWLNEGFATYAEALYWEAAYGWDHYVEDMNYKMDRAKGAAGSLYVEDITSVSSIFNYNRSYAKGAVVLHMLRHVVGDEDFFNILKAYAADPLVAYNSAETGDFQRVAEEVSGKYLDYFFTQWIYGSGYPKYTADWDYSNSGINYIVNLSISQESNPDPTYFTMPIDIRVGFEEGGDTTFTVFNNQPVQEFSFTVSDLPTSITLDPDNRILKEIIEIQDAQDDPTIYTSYQLEQNYPNPFNPSTKINFTVPYIGAGQLVPVKIKVYDVLGNEIGLLLNNEIKAGEHSVIFDTANFNFPISSGVYIYQIIAGSFIESKKMVLMK